MPIICHNSLKYLTNVDSITPSSGEIEKTINKNNKGVVFC